MRIAWVVLLVACDERREPPPQRPIVEELDRLPTVAPVPAVAPKQPTPSLDQVLACFSDPLITPLPHSTSALLLEDFDRDGKTDVGFTYDVLADSVFTGHLAVYRNTGDAKLVEHSSIVAGDMVYAVSSGDIDNDGKVDVVVGDPRGSKTRLFAGNGDGTFVEKPAVASGRKVYGATLADLDNDGKLDLVNELFSDVQVYKGDGKFGFRRTKSIDTGQAPDGPVVADFDNDGVKDLGYGANDEGFFFTLKGPTYKQTVKDEACSDPGYTSGGDFDDDGDIDVGYVCSDSIELRLNDGKGNFKRITYPYGPAEEPIVAADITGDGKTDLLVTHRVRSDDPFVIGARIIVLERDGQEWRERTSGKVPIVNGIGVADMDGDRKLDIVLTTWTGNKAAIYVLLKQDC